MQEQTLDPAQYLAQEIGQIPDNGGGVDAIIALTKTAQTIELVEIQTTGLGAGLPPTVPLAVWPGQSGRIASIKAEIEAYRLAPDRIVGTAQVTTLKSFIDLVNRHMNDGSALFGKVSWPKPALTAVIDYHTTDHVPREALHRIHYAFPVTEEMTAWTTANGKPMEQQAFAEFLEEHVAELASPSDGERNEYERLFGEKFATPAELMGLSRHLEVNIESKVKSAVRTMSGERTIQFEEQHTGASGDPVKIPGIFMISIRAFVDGDPVRIPARLRYRAAGGKVNFNFILYRWEFWLQNEVRLCLESAAEDCDLPAFEGSPEA